jgi:hypothetical protein
MHRKCATAQNHPILLIDFLFRIRRLHTKRRPKAARYEHQNFDPAAETQHHPGLTEEVYRTFLARRQLCSESRVAYRRVGPAHRRGYGCPAAKARCAAPGSFAIASQ